MQISSWTLTSILFLLSVLFLVPFLMISFKKNKDPSKLVGQFLGKKQNRHRLNLILQKSYVQFMKIPLLKGYVRKIRKRLESLNSYDEYTVRFESMKITILTLGITSLVVVLIIIFSKDLLYTYWVMLGAVVVNGMMIDAFVNRIEDRLLKQSAHHFEDARHFYQQTKNVEEAIYEASQTAAYEAALHGERIYEILISEDQQGNLEQYYDVAPNRYYKMFAGICYLISEYGDKFVKTGSMFLHAVSRMIQEINYDILRREKLNYLLKGLTMIAVLPILFTKLIENWARTYFPIMNDFYDGRAGLWAKILFFAVVLLSYVLLRKLLENDESRYVTRAKRILWEKKLYGWAFMKWIVLRFLPKPHSRKHFKLTLLLKQANSPLIMEWFYVQRIILVVLCFIVTISLFMYMHILTVNHTLNSSSKSVGLFGRISTDDQKAAQQQTEFDRKIIEDLKESKDTSKEAIIQQVSKSANLDHNEESVILSAERILSKYNIVKAEYFKWWELLIGICICALVYNIPLWLLIFQRKMRELEMQYEVDQFHSIIAILVEFDRVSVEVILEWMERFSIIFRGPLHTCMLNFDSGAEAALEHLKEEAPFPSFVRIIEKLQLAVEKIPLKAAFDDLEMDIEYYREKRKEHYVRLIEQKSSWGKVIGFAPLTVIMFAYLILPMIYLSIQQMGESVVHLKNIH